jgi:hypothetical protein
MKCLLVTVCVAAILILSERLVFAQAFGEYGRTLGGIPHGQGITGSRAPGRVTQGGKGSGGAGEVSEGCQAGWSSQQRTPPFIRGRMMNRRG